jgi:LmbE family N-acetylglucosaminyl deacetylase
VDAYAPQVLLEEDALLGEGLARDDGQDVGGRLIRPEDAARTSEPEWETFLRSRPELEIPWGDVVVVAPHPDDETLGAGGLICAATASGRRVRVVVCTDGEAASEAPALGSRRRDETMAAVDRLTGGGGRDVVFVGLPDGTLAHSTDAVADAVRPMLASDPLLVAPWSHDGHPDHDAVGRACAALGASHGGIEVWHYPIWAWHWADPQTFASLPVGRLRLDGAVQRAKGRAVHAFTSQITPAHGPPILPPHVRSHFLRPDEAYVLAPRSDR